MDAVLLLAMVALVFTLAAWRMVARWDPPYRGVHEPHGRHRHRAWEGHGEDDAA